MTPATVAWPGMGPEPVPGGPPSCEVYAIGAFGRHEPIGTDVVRAAPAPAAAKPAPVAGASKRERKIQAPALSEDV